MYRFLSLFCILGCANDDLLEEKNKFLESNIEKKGQIEFEFLLLSTKLKIQAIERYNLYKDLKHFELYALFYEIDGNIKMGNI